LSTTKRFEYGIPLGLQMFNSFTSNASIKWAYRHDSVLNVQL